MKFIEELTLPTRTRVTLGDIFAYKIGNDYRFIRVIRDQLEHGYMLFYLYRAASPDPKLIPTLSKEDLLIPPVRNFRYMLRDGVTIKVGDISSAPLDCFESHCFDYTEHPNRHWGPYQDELGNNYDYRFEPCSKSSSWFYLGGYERDMALALKLVNSDAEYDGLPVLLRPLLHAKELTKVPHPLVAILIPRFLEDVAPRLLDQFGVPKGYEKATPGWAARRIFMGLMSKAKMGDLAKQLIWSLPDEHEDSKLSGYWIGSFQVKRKQHDAFYSRIAEFMQEQRIEGYWIEDGVVGSWLARTIGPDHSSYKTSST